MVIVTRSAYKKASESLSSSDISYQNIIPPWCSSGKVSTHRKSRKVPSRTWEAQSSYPLRENIWEYIYENKEKQNCACKKDRRNRTQRERHKRCGKTTVIMCTFLFITVCLIGSVWITNAIPKLNEITNLLQYEKFTTLLPNTPAAVDEECCYRMRYLAAELSRVVKTLRHTQRLRKAVMLTSHSTKSDNRVSDEYIQASRVTIGRNTVEWGGLVALWGIVPLWRAARPPHTVLALRRPTPADCWPFSGSQGELVVELPGAYRVRRVSIEHVRPDGAKSAPRHFIIYEDLPFAEVEHNTIAPAVLKSTECSASASSTWDQTAAKSAPRHFIIYGIAENNTWIRANKEEYKSDGPPKQYYPIISEAPLKRVVFRVLSNQGNPRYTCLYRFHLYGDKDRSIFP